MNEAVGLLFQGPVQSVQYQNLKLEFQEFQVDLRVMDLYVESCWSQELNMLIT